MTTIGLIVKMTFKDITQPNSKNQKGDRQHIAIDTLKYLGPIPTILSPSPRRPTAVVPVPTSCPSQLSLPPPCLRQSDKLSPPQTHEANSHIQINFILC